MLLPMITTEEASADSCGQDQIVVFEAVTGGKIHPLIMSMDPFCLVEPYVNVLVGLENASDRASDVRGR